MNLNRYTYNIIRIAFLLVFCAGFTLVLSACDSDNNQPDVIVPQGPEQDPDDPSDPGSESSQVTLTMVDPNATAETKALYSQLWSIADKGFMFGHHDDLWYGRHWYNQIGKSDTKDVCGDYPAVFSVDFASIMDIRSGWDSESKENAIRRRVILEAYERGEVIIACAHINNPLTENTGSYPTGSSWDNKKCVDQLLLPGSTVNTKYFTWLDRLADFVNNLKGNDGKLIPVIFRPFHEHTQGWSWWGTSATTEQEFINLWRTTVRYLRDTKGVHNLIYAISPQMDADYGTNTKTRLKTRWPGDNYVDFLGMDCYHGSNFTAFASNVKNISELSVEMKKPCGVTENGWEAFTTSDYWTKGILTPTNDQRVSMVVMWRNKYVGTNDSDTHYFSVFPGHPSVADFKTMYDSDKSFFSKNLPNMYKMADKVTVN